MVKAPHLPIVMRSFSKGTKYGGGTLKRKLIMFLLLIGCAPLILSSLYFYNQLQEKYIAENELSGLAAVRAVQADVNKYLDAYMGGLKLLTQNPDIIKVDDPAVLPLLQNAVKLYPDMYIVTMDTAGWQRVRSDSSKLIDLKDRQFFKDAMQGKSAISDVLISRNANAKPIIVLAVPIYNGSNIVGVMHGSVFLDILNKFFLERTTDNKQLFIIDRGGIVVAHSDPNIGNEHRDMKEQPFVKAGQGGAASGTLTITDEKGTKSIVNYVRDEATGWLICSQTPQDVVMQPIYDLRKKFFMAFGTLILIIAVSGNMFANRIVNPVKAIANQAKQVAEGNLKVENLAMTSRDEVGDLARSFGMMVGNLRELVNNIAQSAEQLSASSQQLTAISDQSAQASSQVANLIGEVASGAGSQAAAVASVTRVVEQLSANTERIAANASTATDMSSKTARAASDGAKVIDTALNQMADIERAVTESAAVVTELGERSKEIGQIIDTITNIAGQTNLLALNAAIEAARAGEQGRGFAVVAEEVRKLAEQSESAAKQIASLIAHIQGETEKAVVSMSTGTSEVKKGAAVVGSAAETFNNIVRMVGGVSRQADEISGSMSEMTKNCVAIVETVREIDAVSMRAAGHTQTVSAATEEQLASLEEISSSSQALAKMAQDLQRAIGSFKL